MNVWLYDLLIFTSAATGSWTGGYYIGKYNRRKSREEDEMFIANMTDNIRALREDGQ